MEPLTGKDIQATHLVYELLEAVAGERGDMTVALQMGKIFLETEAGTITVTVRDAGD